MTTPRDRLGRIPAEVTGLVGRRHDITEVRRLLSSARLVTLTGVGGCGKTRLAVRVAGGLRRAFTDGVWLVDLAPVTDAALVEYAIAEALGLDVHTGQPLAEVVPEYLRDRELLLVLDNCEHLVDACATFVGRALRTAVGLRVLCTSRQVLGMLAEHVWDVAPLAAADPEQPPEPGELSRYPAVALFLERAATVRPGFTLNAGNGRLVAQICHQLDGLPLAIELAAARLRTLSLAELATGLRDHFRLLETSNPVPARHRRLESAFDWSFTLCSPREQTLWLRLSVFTDSFGLPAAEYVFGDPAGDTLDLLAGLIDKSVLSRSESPDGVRYRLLGTVRRYALGRLRERDTAHDRDHDRDRDGDSDGEHERNGMEERRLRDRHRDWYLDLAERFDADWFSPRQVDWASRMRTEYGNVRAALDYCLGPSSGPEASPEVAAGTDAETGSRLAAALKFYWSGCGGPHEGRYWLERALALLPESSPTRLPVLYSYAFALGGQLDTAAVIARSQEMSDLAQRLDQPAFIARSVGCRGLALLVAGDSSRALATLTDALDRFTRLGELKVDAAMVMGGLAMATVFQGDLAQAEALCARCRESCEAHGDLWMLGNALISSAAAASTAGDLPQATGYARRSLQARHQLGDTLGIASSVERLAWLAASSGDHERAARLIGAADQRWRAVGRSRYGSVLWMAGRDEAAQRCRTALGASAFAAAVASGAGLTVAEAVRYALDEAQPVTPEHTGPPAAILTPRESQVARLVAEGLSNHQISTRLVTSQRTAESHVQNILRKLDFTSRAQVAAWMAGQPDTRAGQPDTRASQPDTRASQPDT